MNTQRRIWPVTLMAVLCSTISTVTPHSRAIGADDGATGPVQRLLYVATPGVRDYLEYGGHGLLVFDIDHDHRVVKRIATAGLSPEGKPLNVKGISASAATRKLYISTTRQLMCLDLVTEKLLWEKTFELGTDRMAMTPDGSSSSCRRLKDRSGMWSGPPMARRSRGSPPTRAAQHHRRSRWQGRLPGRSQVAVSDGRRHGDVRACAGRTLQRSIRPFTVDGRQTRCFVNVNELLGFEVGDLSSGRKLSSRGRRIPERTHQAARLSQSRHRLDARREGALADRCGELHGARLRRDRHAA